MGWPEKPSLPVILMASALVCGVKRHTVEPAEEIEMPPRAPEFAVSRKLQPDLFLLFDDLLDLAVFDILELRRCYPALRVLGPRFLQRRGPQQAADVIGAEWRRRALRGHLPSLST